jgi:hypothetical protein
MKRFLVFCCAMVLVWMSGFGFAKKCYDQPWPQYNDIPVSVKITGYARVVVYGGVLEEVYITRLDTGQKYAMPPYFKMTQAFLDKRAAL